jgi:two-component system KDP operon response regulator KdpE
MNGKPILVVDAEAPSRRLLHVLLTKGGFTVSLATSGRETLDQVAVLSPVLIILAPPLPDINWLQLCRELGEWTESPIMVVSAEDNEAAKVNALDLGADDYITKPFGQAEFMARVRAVLRRARRDSPPPVIEIGNVRVDETHGRVSVAGRDVHLTPTESQILRQLMSNGGKIVTYSTLLRTIWGETCTEAIPTLRVFIAQLRRKIEPDPERPTYILTEPRIGYRFGHDT